MSSEAIRVFPLKANALPLPANGCMGAAFSMIAVA
jgi:hypothetical protein